MLRGCLVFGAAVAVVGWHGRVLGFLPTTVQTDPALGAEAAAEVKVVGFAGAGGVLLIVIGWEALRPGCGVLVGGLRARYSARRFSRAMALAGLSLRYHLPHGFLHPWDQALDGRVPHLRPVGHNARRLLCRGRSRTC